MADDRVSLQPQAPHKAPAARSNILSLLHQVWENPYFPLNGPPRNQREQEILQKAIIEERAKVREELSRTRNVDLDSMAASNCADLQWDVQKCLKSYTLSGWTGLCRLERKKLKECLFMQKDILQELGYSKLRANVTPRERMLMAERADEIYLQRMKQRDEESQTSPPQSK
ncbi:hypothetical protein HDU67_007405 [Dinochytrium kinnereticum]|nr:hypothetical protein HDU67_007405 [Dinochytrium kinnereticum]